MNKDNVNALISAAYSATLSPENYDDIMDVFDDLIFTETNQDSGYVISPDLAMHFERAHEIYNKLGRHSTANLVDKKLVDTAPCPAIIFDQSERILAMNALANKPFPRPCKTLSEYCSYPQSLERIRIFITNTDGANILIEPGGLRADGKTNTCILVRTINRGKISGQSLPTDAAENQFFLTSIDLGFDRLKTALFQKTYNLTDAETEIATRLADGQQPQEISQIRRASLATIRTQIKILKQKTACRDIPGIVRLVYGFSAGLFVSSQASNTSPSYMQIPSSFKRQGSITLRDGRKMSYMEHGNTHGKPAIFIHGMMYGSGLLDKTSEAAARQNLRIITPCRPGYGLSDPISNASARYDAAFLDKMLDEVANDIYELLDRLGIAKAMILGNSAGSVYALRFAHLFPNRTSALFAINQLPIWRDEWMGKLPKRQRLIARIAKYTPQLLPLVTRTAVALIDHGRVDKLVDALHKDISADMTALKKPGVYDLVCAGIEEIAAQGADAFCRDCILLLRDYSHQATNLKTPFHIIRGEGDMNVPLSHLENFIQIAPKTTLEMVKGAGQFLLYSHWEYVLNALKKSSKKSEK